MLKHPLRRQWSAAPVYYMTPRAALPRSEALRQLYCCMLVVACCWFYILKETPERAHDCYHLTSLRPPLFSLISLPFFADVFRCATVPAAVHRSKGAVLHGLLHVRHGHQPDRALSRRGRHTHPLQRVRRHVQHALHHPFQLDCRIQAWRRGTCATLT